MPPATMKYGSLIGFSNMNMKTVFPLAVCVFAIAGCQDNSKHKKALRDEDIAVTTKNADLLLESCLKSDILQDRLWASAFISINSGEHEMPSQRELVDNQERYLRWFDQLPPGSKEQMNQSFIDWIPKRSPQYWRTVTVVEFMRKGK